MAGDAWYVYAHEYALVEACVLMVMIPIALVFDLAWHNLSHWVEHTSFVYGGRERVDDDEDSHGHDPHGEHKKLGAILLKRMGTEFMTLGFLALLVFTSQYNGFFDALVYIVPAGCSEDGSYDDDYDHRRLADGRSLGEDCFHLPASGLDWFHVVEIVHFSLFGGMCLYFVLMFGFVQGGVRKILAWENIRYMDMESAGAREKRRTAGEPSTYQLLKPSMWGLLPQDHEYRCMQGKFVDNLIVMSDGGVEDASFQRRLLERCGIVAGDPDTYSKLQEELKGASFDFSAYLSLQLEEAVSDSIEIHSSSWIAVWIYLLIASLFYVFASVSMPVVALFIILPPTLAWFAGCSWVFRAQQVAIAERGYHRSRSVLNSARDLEALTSRMSKDTAGAFLQGRRLLRVAQIVCIVCSYVLARLAFLEWQSDFSVTLVATIAMGALWVLMMLWLSFHSPSFLALMSMPPHFSSSNDKAMMHFWKAFNPEHALKVKSLEQRIEVSRAGTRPLGPLRQDSTATWSDDSLAALPSCEEEVPGRTMWGVDVWISRLWQKPTGSEASAPDPAALPI
jgi:hypothetical protein